MSALSPSWTPREQQAIANYQAIVQLPTVSRLGNVGVDWEPFRRFRTEIAERYPALHQQLALEVVREHALLFRWAGRRPAAAPTVLMAHYDVVAAEDEGWSVPPFAAEIVDWEGEPTMVARGSIDDKASLLGILEAVEESLEEGFQPEADVYLALTHNEEVLGDGTPGIVELLDQRGIRPRLVLDEGGIVGESILGPIDADVICIGVSEKGTGTVRLTLTSPGGHAAVPPQETATVRMARTLVAIQDHGTLPMLSDVNRSLIRTLGPHARGPLAHAARHLEAGDDAAAIEAFSRISLNANAMVHSTPVVTVMNSGITTNAIPERATAYVNLRIAPGHSAQIVLDRLREAITDPTVTVEILELKDASPVSPAEGPEWDLIVSHIRSTYGDHVVVVPYVNNGGTDSRNYTGISGGVYRFSPYDMTLAERESLHAIDERLRISSFTDGLAFYRTLVRDL